MVDERDTPAALLNNVPVDQNDTFFDTFGNELVGLVEIFLEIFGSHVVYVELNVFEILVRLVPRGKERRGLCLQRRCELFHVPLEQLSSARRRHQIGKDGRLFDQVWNCSRTC